MKKQISVLMALLLAAALVFAGCTKNGQEATDDTKESQEVKNPDESDSESEEDGDTESGEEGEKENGTGQADGSSATVEEEYILMTSLLGVPGATAFTSDYQETLKYYKDNEMGYCLGINYIPEKEIFFVTGSFEQYEGSSTGYMENGEWHDNPRTYLAEGERSILYAKDVVLTLSGGEAEPKRVGIDEFFDAAHNYNGLGLLLHVVNGVIISADISS